MCFSHQQDYCGQAFHQWVLPSFLHPSELGTYWASCLQLSRRNHSPSSGRCCYQCQLVMLISVNSSKTLLPILFFQSYNTKIQLHFRGGIVFFPLSALLCLLWVSKKALYSRARGNITNWHCQGSDNTGCISSRSPLRGMRGCVWVMHNYIFPETGAEKAGANCICKVAKVCRMAAHKVMVQMCALQHFCVCFRHWKRKDICFPWWNLHP